MVKYSLTARREAVENAVTDARLEGRAPTPEAQLLFEQFVQGELTEEQLVSALLLLWPNL